MRKSFSWGRETRRTGGVGGVEPAAEKERNKVVEENPTTHTFRIPPPLTTLGCTVEESTCETDAGRVFVSGFPDDTSAPSPSRAAGLEIGDVVVGVSGIFGDVVEKICCCEGDRLETVRGLVKGRIQEGDKELVIVVERGTGVMERHEEAFKTKVTEAVNGVGGDEEKAVFEVGMEDEVARIMNAVYEEEIFLIEEGVQDTCGEEDVVDMINLVWSDDEQGNLASLMEDDNVQEDGDDEEVMKLTAEEEYTLWKTGKVPERYKEMEERRLQAERETAEAKRSTVAETATEKQKPWEKRSSGSG
eukprot:CAMPEP_0118666112 /NCGR_PEP_ID=MMETSP0785-20121206/19021_1 /TAXON_ID=91992 /ORGANISM="Bolidomonas pacifica, Strain CCMP 1866" /LENGTH=302 /DNA_ID=CAMNT_0006560361 /DNA_START=168 /DNA_END=1073 /DNA_ORIENTATION=+